MDPELGKSVQSETRASGADRPAPLFVTILVAGLFGQMAFEIYAWFISPAVFAVTLEPAVLVMNFLRHVFGTEISYTQAFLIHFSVGLSFSLMVFIFGYVTRVGYVLSGAITGGILWFISLGLLAPIVGFRFMADFGVLAQSALIAHVGMATIMGWLIRKFLSDRKANRSPR